MNVSYKIVIGGDGAVGKTTLLTRYVEGHFLFESKMTIGVEIHKKILLLYNSNYGKINCELQLWDFGGQERFRFLLDSFVMGANGAILMFDLHRFQTLFNIEKCVPIVKKYDSNLPIVLIGSKLDLVEDTKKQDETVKELMETHNFLKYVKVSSKTGDNVNECFDILVKNILDSTLKVGEDKSAAVLNF
jgi:small GTP-binding protein